MADVILAAGLYDANDNLVASWDTLITEYSMDIKADQISDVSANAPANVLAKSELSNGTKLVISDSVTRIGANAFAMLDTLVSVVIPDSVTSIGYGAFNSCYALVSVNIPTGITTIGHTTFFECKKLTSINIPAGVTSIEYRAFCFCDALTDVYYGGTAEQWQAISISADNTKLTSATIHYNENGGEEVEGQVLIATISYKNETVTTLVGGEYAILNTSGVEMEGDIRVDAMQTGVSSIPLQEKEVTENGNVLPDTGYAGLSKVVVNVPEKIPSGYIKPSGTKNITTNGTHDVKNYESVNVQVPTTGGGGGECSGEHVIPVDELPTENIDTNAVYLCKGEYYKYAQFTGFIDMIMVTNGSASLFGSMADAEGIDWNVYTIPTRTAEGVQRSDLNKGQWNLYYIEDEANICVNVASAEAGDEEIENSWMPFSAILGVPNNGAVSDISEATEDGYYALMGSVFNCTKYHAITGTLTITESGTHDVSGYVSAEVNIPDAAICGIWRFNDTIDPVIADGIERFQMVNFTSVNGSGVETAYYGFSMAYESHTSKELNYIINPDVSGGATVYEAWNGESWNNEWQKVVDFGTEPQMIYSAFKEWLEANATRQEVVVSDEVLNVTPSAERQVFNDGVYYKSVSVAPVPTQTLAVKGSNVDKTYTPDDGYFYSRVTVKPADPSTLHQLCGIYFVNLPKTEYIVQDGLSIAGGQLCCQYTDGTTQYVDLSYGMVTNFDAAYLGTRTIIVAYSEGGITSKTTYQITVSEA